MNILVFFGFSKIKEPFWSFQAPDKAMLWLNLVPETNSFWRFEAPET